MNSRIGIELSPASCRIVEVTDAPGGDDRPRVMASDRLAASGPETRARLAALASRSAGVVIWNARNDHRQVMVPAGRYESMRGEALRRIPGRRLAMINGRILALGDLVGAASIIDITTEAVLLRDPQAQTRKLVLGAFAR